MLRIPRHWIMYCLCYSMITIIILQSSTSAFRLKVSNTFDRNFPAKHDNRLIRGRILSMRQQTGGFRHNGDVLVIGGGLAGLSAALELAQRGAKVVIVNRDGKESASLAAGGMLAPQSERLEAGPYLDLCLESRNMYSEWATALEEISGGISTGFAASGGFLAPAFPGDTVDSWIPPASAGVAYRLDATQIRVMEPYLSPEIQGGWWYPDDMQVDARCLYRSLKEACLQSGVSILEGEDWEVEALVFHPVNPAVQAVKLRNGRRLSFPKVLVANGAWMNRLLPVPMHPVKGQMLSLRPAKDQPLPLNRVIFAENCYLIPKSDGRLIVGATVEPNIWDQRVTAAGLLELTSRALRICPALGDLQVEETWAGLRPTTPDTLPVLGRTPWENLFVAGGYWRNGVLLAPRTGQLIADIVENSSKGEADDKLSHFAWNRFLPGNARLLERTGAKPAETFQGQSISLSQSPPPPSKQMTSRAQPSASTPMTSSVHNDDPYADYVKLNKQANSDDVIREARRQNREGMVAYGLGEDPLGRQVASKFNIPSSGLSEDWSRFEEAAKSGKEFMSKFDIQSHLDAGMGATGGPSAFSPHDDDVMPSFDGMHEKLPDSDGESIDELLYRLGYDYEDPRLAKIRRRDLVRQGYKEAEADAPKSSKSKPMDAYEEVYSEEIRPKVGWQVALKMKEELERNAASPTSPTAPQVHNDDPYADYVKLNKQANSDDVIREARRQNREGMVAYGLGEDPLGRQVASKFNIPSSGLSEDWSRFEEAAKSGLRAMQEFEGRSVPGLASPVVSREENNLGPHEAPPVSSSSSSSSSWAPEIEAVYEKLLAYQTAQRKRRGQPPLSELQIPFKHAMVTNDEGVSQEELLEKLEIFRANPDGSLTKVERGKGLPPPWDPAQAKAVANSEADNNFQTLN